MATIQEFKDYVKKNWNTIDALKLRNLDKKGQQDLFKTWSTTGSLGEGFTKKNPLKINTATKTGQAMQQQRNDLVNQAADSFKITNPVEPKSSITPAPSINEPLRQSDNARLWPTATGNVLDDKLKQTGLAYEANQERFVNDTVKANQEAGQTKSELITKTNEAKRDRYDNQQATLDANKAAAEARIAASKWDADSMLRRQESIAARQANIAAGRAGESGLQMSAGAVQDIQDDIISKYATNLATAEDFRNKTNMSLNDALTRVAGDTFKDKQAIDNFVNSLDDSEIQPLLAATDAALKGKTDAATAIKDYHATLLQKKAEGEFNRSDKVERLADNERQWRASDNASKLALLQAEFTANGVQAPIMDDFIANPDKYKNMTYAEALNSISKLDANKKLIDAAIPAILASGAYDKLPDSWKQVAETSGKENSATQSQINRTAEQKANKVAPSAQMEQTKWGMDLRTDVTTKFGFTGKNKVDIDKLINEWKFDTIKANMERLFNKGSLDIKTYNTMANHINKSANANQKITLKK